MSEPMVSHDCIGFICSRRRCVAPHQAAAGIGQGADEVFGGYPLVSPARWQHRRGERLPPPSATATMPITARWCSPVSPPRISAAASWPSTLPARRRRPGQGLCAWTPRSCWWTTRSAGRQHDHGLRPGGGCFPRPRLVRSPAASGAAQLRGTAAKGVLKETARRVIPSAVIDRPGYCSVPGLWVPAGLHAGHRARRPACQAARERGLFNAAYVDRLLANRAAHHRCAAPKLWQLGLLEWCVDPSRLTDNGHEHVTRALRPGNQPLHLSGERDKRDMPANVVVNAGGGGCQPDLY